jgi:hypothetical protein
MIAESDAPALLELLGKGFPEREIDYWRDALETLARRDAPEGYPRFGYLLEAEGQNISKAPSARVSVISPSAKASCSDPDLT